MNNEPNKKTIEYLLNIFNQKKYHILVDNILDYQNKYQKSIFLLNLLGATYNELDKPNYAINCFKKIIEIDNNFADAYYNLGIIYKKLGNIKESINNYNLCININPKKFDAYNNLGNLYRDKNDFDKAIEKYIQCLEINPEYLIALQNFGICLQNFSFTHWSGVFDKHIIKLLEKDKILRPVDIINTLINYLFLNPNFKLIIENYEKIESQYSLKELFNKVLDFKIFINLLEITPIPDLRIEKFLQFLRKKILFNVSSISENPKSYQIMSSIAKQCYINEYLYPINIEEKKELRILEKKIIYNLNNNSQNKVILEISCLAAYKKLDTYNWSDRIINLEKIKGLVSQQIINPKIENELKNKFLSKSINNSVSLKVKEQYEQNPYPRWTKISLNYKPNEVHAFLTNLNLNIDKENIKNWKNINILVAGCGTGQHAITTATKFKNSYVTAIDLSKKSLSYAKRKSNELEIKNIDYKHMDILNLANYGKKFELIESVGVLHHMENPFMGLKILTNILKTNGLIMIGLYSEKAREHIKRLRSNFKKYKYEINEENIKILREKIISSNNLDNKLIRQSPDFYSLSSVRDLLFHVQEHRFTIKKIIEILNNLNLKFCGFENRNAVIEFQKIYKNKEDLYNLDYWDKFENKNPRTFAGMYQFWCQKT